MPFLQCRGGRLFPCPIFTQIFHIGVEQIYPEPFPVTAIVQFQIRCIFLLIGCFVHDITIKDRHGMILTDQLWLSGQLSAFP